MPTLTNPKHERFAQELAKGRTADESYVAAGYVENHGNAGRLKANEVITARVAELLARAAAKVEVTAETIAMQLDEDRALARQLKQMGAAVAASMGKAKLFGLITDKVQGRLTVNDGRADELGDDELAHIASRGGGRTAAAPVSEKGPDRVH